MLENATLYNDYEEIVTPSSLLTRPNIIDIEASGFGSHSYPIEIGIVLSTSEKYCSLIQPDLDWQHWDKSAEAVHGITRSTLLEYGKPISTVALELNELMSGQPIYSDGWVVDQPWLNKLFFAAGVVQKFRFSPLETILKETQMDVWHLTKDRISKELNLSRHRASNDALIIQETFAQTLNLKSSIDSKG